MQRTHGQFGELQNAHVPTAPAEPCSRCRNHVSFVPTATFGNLMRLGECQPSPAGCQSAQSTVQSGTAAMLTLGKVSCPTRSCRCLMVLKAKVLMAKGSHRIMDKSLRRSKNPTLVIHNQQPHCTGPSPAVCT